MDTVFVHNDKPHSQRGSEALWRRQHGRCQRLAASTVKSSLLRMWRDNSARVGSMQDFFRHWPLTWCTRGLEEHLTGTRCQGQHCVG